MFRSGHTAGREYRVALLAPASALPEKKSYPLRINADVLKAMKRWSDDDLRSLNAQIEYVLRDALRKQGRLKERSAKPVETDNQDKET